MTPTPGSPNPSPRPRALSGRLRLAGMHFVDDAGDVLPVFCHFGEALSAFVRRPNAVRQQLDAIAAAGYHGVRFWDVLGYYDGAWSGREVTPVPFANRRGQPVGATPHYYAQLRAFLQACDERQLAVMHDRGDLNSWTGAQKPRHLREVGALYRGLGATGYRVLAGLWACNEGYQNGVTTPEEAADLIRAFAEGAGALPDVRGLSAPNIPELHDLRAWSVDPATIVTIHPSRDSGTHHRIRHVFTNGYEKCAAIGKPGWNTEPTGPGPRVTVGREEDPAVLGALAAVSLISRQAWTYMSSRGVIWHGPIEQQPGFASVPALCRRLPDDVMRFETLGHGGSHWQQVRPLVAEGDNRFDYAAHGDGRFAGVAYGPRLTPLRVARRARFTVIDPATAQDVYEGVLDAGARLPLSGAARIVIGQTV